MKKLNYISKLTLRKKILFLGASVVLIFTLIIGSILWQTMDNKYSDLNASITQENEKFQSSISQNFHSLYHNVQAFSQNTVFKTQDKSMITLALNEMVNMFPSYDYMLLLDTKGALISSSSISHDGKNLNTDKISSTSFATKKWFKESLDPQKTSNYDKKIFGTYFSDIHENQTSQLLFNEKKTGQFFNTPILDEFGDPVAVLVTFASLRWITSEVNNFYKGTNPDDINYITTYLTIGNKTFEFKKGKKSLTTKTIKTPVKENHKSYNSLSVLKNELDLWNSNPVSHPKFINVYGWKTSIKQTSSHSLSTFLVNFRNTSIILLFTSLLILFLFWKASNGIVRNISQALSRLNKSTEETKSEVIHVKQSSDNIMTSSKSQSQNIMETMSALEEIKMMSQKTNQTSQESTKVSEEYSIQIDLGEESIKDVSGSILSIEQSNVLMMQDIEVTFKELNKINDMVSQLGDKLKHIDDIVFQTQLLSFNASVEAARAGEAGKGFAVVAQEIGNLANSSSQISKDIGSMIDHSTESINTIILDAVKTIEKRHDQITKRIKESNTVNKKCSQVFNEMSSHTKTLFQMMQEIAIASSEQQDGIGLIYQSVNSLDQESKNNLDVAVRTKESSDKFSQQVDNLIDISSALNFQIHGNKKRKAS